MPKTAKAEDITMSLQSDLQAAGNDQARIRKAIRDNETELVAKLSTPTAESVAETSAWASTMVDDAAVHLLLIELGEWFEKKLAGHVLKPFVKPAFAWMATQVPGILSKVQSGDAAEKIRQIKEYVLSFLKPGGPGQSNGPPQPPSDKAKRAHLGFTSGHKRALTLVSIYCSLARFRDFRREIGDHWFLKEASNFAAYMYPEHEDDLPEIDEPTLQRALDYVSEIRDGDMNHAIDLNELMKPFAVYFAMVELTGTKELPWYHKYPTMLAGAVDEQVNREQVRDWVVAQAQANGPNALRLARQTYRLLLRWTVGGMIAGVVVEAIALTMIAAAMFGTWSLILGSWVVTWMAIAGSILAGLLVGVILSIIILPVGDRAFTSFEWWNKKVTVLLTAMLVIWFGLFFLVLIGIWLIDSGIVNAVPSSLATNTAIWSLYIGGLLVHFVARFLLLPVPADIYRLVVAAWKGVVSPVEIGSVSRFVLERFVKRENLPPVTVKGSGLRDKPGREVNIGITLSFVICIIILCDGVLWLAVGPTYLPLWLLIMTFVAVILTAEAVRKWNHRFSKEENDDEVRSAKKAFKGLLLSFVVLFVLASAITCAFGAGNLTRMGDVWHKAIGKGVDWTEEQVEGSGNSPRETDDSRVEEIRKRHSE